MRYQNLDAVILLASALLAAALAAPRAADAAATITVVNLDGAGEGFNDPSAPDAASTAGGNTGASLGDQRLIAFQRAAEIWGQFVESSVHCIQEFRRRTEGRHLVSRRPGQHTKRIGPRHAPVSGRRRHRRHLQQRHRHDLRIPHRLVLWPGRRSARRLHRLPHRRSP
jgi:hypothetical protein